MIGLTPLSDLIRELRRREASLLEAESAFFEVELAIQRHLSVTTGNATPFVSTEIAGRALGRRRYPVAHLPRTF